MLNTLQISSLPIPRQGTHGVFNKQTTNSSCQHIPQHKLRTGIYAIAVIKVDNFDSLTIFATLLSLLVVSEEPNGSNSTHQNGKAEQLNSTFGVML